MSEFNGATLLITGGTGSFGSTALKHFLATDIGQIRIFSRDEKKQDDMRHELQAKYPDHAGKVGQQYWAQNAKYHFCNIVLWVDTDYADRKVDEQKIESPSIIEKADFDYVLIAVDGYYVAKEIVVYLNQCRVKREKQSS